MKRLFEFLLTGCFHEWEVENKTIMYQPEGLNCDVNGEQLPSGMRYTLRCKKCGELKTYKDY